MNKKALISASAAVATATLSGIILYDTLIANNILGEFGLLGIFLSSLFSHLTVIGRGIFGPTFLLLASIYNPFVLGSFAGWGGAIGEVTTYFLGSAIRGAVEEEKENSLTKWINRYGMVLILFLAATPLPDTPIILLAGSSRFPVFKILIIEGVGKSIFYSFGAIFGSFFFTSLADVIGSILTSTFIVGASIAFCTIISWEKTRNKIFGMLRKLFKINP